MKKNQKTELVQSEIQMKTPIPSLWIFVRYTVTSLLLIHLFGLFGFLIGLAYPIWWFFLPQQTFCFYCLHIAILDKNGVCPVCKRTVTTIYDPPFYSVFINMVTILLLSALALGVIIFEIQIVSKQQINPLFFFSKSKVTFMLPEKNQFPLGTDFYIDVDLAAKEAPINVAQTDMQFTNQLFSVKDIQTDQSFATIFTQKDYSNQEGWIRIVGGLPNPGFQGDKAHLARIFFTPKKTGIGTIHFLPTTTVLANDGKGTPVATEFRSANVVIVDKGQKTVLGTTSVRTLGDVIIEKIQSLILKLFH